MGPLTVLAACAYESHEDTLKDVTVQLPLQALLWNEARAVVSPIHFSSPNIFLFLLGSHSADVTISLHLTTSEEAERPWMWMPQHEIWRALVRLRDSSEPSLRARKHTLQAGLTGLSIAFQLLPGSWLPSHLAFAVAFFFF